MLRKKQCQHSISAHVKMATHCVKCKTKTESGEGMAVTAKNGRAMISSPCAACGTKKVGLDPRKKAPIQRRVGTSRKPSPKPPHTEHHLPVVTTTGIEKASFARDVSSRRTSRRHAAARRTPRPRRAGGGGRLLLLRRREVCRDKRVDRWQNMHENRARAHTHTHTHTHTLAVEHEKREDRPPPQPRGMYLFSICEKCDTKNKWFDKRRCHGTWVTPTEGARRNSKNKERLNNRKRH